MNIYTFILLSSVAVAWFWMAIRVTNLIQEFRQENVTLRANLDSARMRARHLQEQRPPQSEK